MIYASKTSYFAIFHAPKRLILQFFTSLNVLFCNFSRSKTSYFAKSAGIRCNRIQYMRFVLFTA